MSEMTKSHVKVTVFGSAGRTEEILIDKGSTVEAAIDEADVDLSQFSKYSLRMNGETVELDDEIDEDTALITISVDQKGA